MNKLYLVSQSINNGYDTYDSMVVAAESEQDARLIHPSEFCTHIADGKWVGERLLPHPRTGYEYYPMGGDDWITPQQIGKLTVQYLGETEHGRGVVCSSFNAG